VKQTPSYQISVKQPRGGSGIYLSVFSLRFLRPVVSSERPGALYVIFPLWTGELHARINVCVVLAQRLAYENSRVGVSKANRQQLCIRAPQFNVLSRQVHVAEFRSRPSCGSSASPAHAFGKQHSTAHGLPPIIAPARCLLPCPSQLLKACGCGTGASLRTGTPTVSLCHGRL